MLLRITILFFPLFLLFFTVSAQEKYDTIPVYHPELLTYNESDTTTELSIYKDDFIFLDTIRKAGLAWYEDKLCLAFLIDNMSDGYLCHLIGIYGIHWQHRNLFEYTSDLNTQASFHKFGKKELMIITLDISIESTDSSGRNEKEYMHNKQLQIWDLNSRTCVLSLTIDADQAIYPPMTTDAFLETYKYKIPYRFERKRLIIGEVENELEGHYSNPLAGTFRYHKNCFLRVD